MKCLFDMTPEDLECICKTLHINEWEIRDTYSNEYVNNRALSIMNNDNSKFYYTYHYLIEQASIKDIYKNSDYYIQGDPRSYNHKDPNIEIISWMDSLSIIRDIVYAIQKQYKKEVNIIMEYCLSEAKTYNLNNEEIVQPKYDPLRIENFETQIYNPALDNRIDYILTFKNIIYIIEFTEIGTNKQNDVENIEKDKQAQIQKYIMLIENYMTKEQKIQ